MRLRLSEALRLLWGLLLLLALAASPLLALVLLALISVVVFRPFHRKEYGRPSMTLRGEVVRSNSEKVIADYFSRSGIRYVYEQPAMSRWGFRRISKPDFYLPDWDVYVEYWGLVGLPDCPAKSKYERSMRWKMEQYRRNGTRLVSLFSSDLGNLDAVFRPELAQATGPLLG